jgi:hypothetical protein
MPITPCNIATATTGRLYDQRRSNRVGLRRPAYQMPDHWQRRDVHDSTGSERDSFLGQRVDGRDRLHKRHKWRRQFRRSGRPGCAIYGGQLDGSDRLVDLRFEAARFMRDPDGVTAHGVVTLEATVEESLL